MQEEPEVFISSPSSKPMPKWMKAAAIFVGILALYTAYKNYTEQGLKAGTVYNLIAGIICLYGSRIDRRLYLSDVGVVREVHSWGRVIRRVLDWDDIVLVSVAYRPRQVMFFFGEGSTGWKVPFDRAQEKEVRDILDDMIPGIEIEELGEKNQSAGGKKK